MQTKMVKVPTFNGQAEMSLDVFIEYQTKMCNAAQIANSVKNPFPNSSTVGQIEGRLLLAAPAEAQKVSRGVELGVSDVDISSLSPDVGVAVNTTFYRFDATTINRLVTVVADVDVSHKLFGVDLEICWDKANGKWMTPVLTKAFAEKMGLVSRSLSAYLFGSKYDHARRIDLGDGLDNFNFTRSNFHINAA